MNGSAQKKIEREIVELLEKERAMLMTADFESLKSVADDKQRILSEINEANRFGKTPVVKCIKRMAEENARLYEASLMGLKLASHRLADIATALKQLKTYDGNGNVSQESTASPSVSFRA